MDAVSGKKAVFKSLIGPKDELSAVAWFFDGGSGMVRVVTVNKQKEDFEFEGYRGRVEVNHTSGFLTLRTVSANDNGRYFLNIWTAKGLMTGDTTLRVLGELLCVTSANEAMFSVMSSPMLAGLTLLVVPS